MSEIRINQNYRIIEVLDLGDVELVIGHNPNAPNPYVCWYYNGGYFWGYYCDTLASAKKKLQERSCRIREAE